MIDVTCALICDGGRILAVQRGTNSSHPMKWEFPGGKLQQNETAEEGIVREIKEELLADIEVKVQLESVEFDYGNKLIRLIPFVCQLVKGTVELTEHVDLCWIIPEEWAQLDWAEADAELIQKNINKIKLVLNQLT